jgi:hypothetical protein
VITAVVLGGVNIFGGSGTMSSVLMAVLVPRLRAEFAGTAGVTPEQQQIVTTRSGRDAAARQRYPASSGWEAFCGRARRGAAERTTSLELEARMLLGFNLLYGRRASRGALPARQNRAAGYDGAELPIPGGDEAYRRSDKN